MNDNNIVIESLGVYLPNRAVATRDIIEACKNVVRYPLERLTGIESRRMAGETEFSIDLAKSSIAQCLARSKYQPADIDVLVCCNISRYDRAGTVTFEPSTAVQLRDHFRFDNALSYDISNACAGMFTGINMADGLIKSGMARRVLVVSGEYITHLTKATQQQITDSAEDLRIACLTLGDSGAAVILEASDRAGVGFHDIDMFTIGAHSDLCIAQPTDEGPYVMETQSMKLHQIAITESIKFVVEKIRQNPWMERKVSHFLMHQTARTAITQTARGIHELLGRTLWHSRNVINNLRHRGNTSTTSHFVALWDKIQDNSIQAYDTVMFAVQASGITIGAAPYTFDDLPERLRSEDAPQKQGGDGSPVELTPLRVCVAGVGTARRSGDGGASSVTLATNAVNDCLARSSVRPGEVDLLINAGVYRDRFLVEPAVATIIAGNAGLNAQVSDLDTAKTFAFDLGGGASGFLYGCFSAQAMVLSGKFRNVMMVTSEIENNRHTRPEQLLGLQECGGAMLLRESNGSSGFRRFAFNYYCEHLGAFASECVQNKGGSYLRFHRTPDFEQRLLDCIPDTVTQLLADEPELELADIAAVFPPQVSADFAAALAERIGVSKDRMVALDDAENLYTASTPVAMRYALDRELVKPGDIALIIEAGSGIQVACATYQF
jgi:3-oxoacyl-[acyl-carrier-protein] synthase III